MSLSSDISNLYKLFGGSADQYQEISRQEDEHESQMCGPAIAAADPMLALAEDGQPCYSSRSAPKPELVSGACIEPVVQSVAQGAEATQAEIAATELSAWSAAGLQGLLAKLALDGHPDAPKEEPVQQVKRSRPQLDHIKVIAVVSAKGGVGRTTLVANLAVALEKIGQSVVALDLDPQNALCHHFQPAAGRQVGATTTVGISQFDHDWGEFGVPGNAGVFVLPHGLVEECQRRDFEQHLDSDSFWLAQHLHDLQLAAGTVVIIDTPPGPSLYLRQALTVSNVALVVSLADAASYTTLPMINHLIEQYTVNCDDFVGSAYLINQVDNSRQLNKNIALIMHNLLGERVVGVVHYDQSVTEALAYGHNVLDYDPHGRGCHDILQCAQALISQLAASIRSEQVV